MKVPLVAFMLLVGVGIAVQVGYDNSVTYISPEPERIEVEVTPDWAEDEDAVKAAQDVIRKKELEAKEADLVSQISTLQDELDEVRKELGTY